jgi:hypothetical protein
MQQIKNFARDLSSKDIIPDMEQKVRVLNQQVVVFINLLLIIRAICDTYDHFYS